MAKKIPVSIKQIAGAKEGEAGSIEVFMDLSDFETTGGSVRDDIREFRNSYLGAVNAAKHADAQARAGGRVSTRRRWKACRILADFNRTATNKFEIMNYKEAYARDFGVPLRSVRAYLDFGAYFSDGEVLDEIPFSLYAELVFRISALRAAGRFEDEKVRLVKMGRSGTLPRRDVYRRSLRS